ncbi:unnamed protein product [Sphagnum jensenii]|uniref:Phosphoadenosine phosphosulphate reductase domain-containing protein n=1 Tax=Sphagnum jensenii TaxID=128206 RepID=A0ABP0VML0_9BRYO
MDGGVGSLVKWNPLANVVGTAVWSFLRTMDVPVNALHSQGFVSIGCEPCTRPVMPGQHEREGRWWWEDAKAKECGLHNLCTFPTILFFPKNSTQVIKYPSENRDVDALIAFVQAFQ